MNTPRFIVEETVGSKPTVFILRGAEHHHLKNVLRLQAGHLVELISRADKAAYRAKVAAVDKDQTTLEIAERVAEPKIPAVGLVVGIAKPKACDDIVEKVVELGIRSIHFFNAERTQHPVNRESLSKRIERWGKISDAALKQSGFHAFPQIKLHEDIEAALRALSSPSFRILLVPPEAENVYAQGVNIHDVINRNRGQIAGLQGDSEGAKGDLVEPVLPIELGEENAESYLMVGPEGGLTEKEIAIAQEHEFVKASLGVKTLRVETAAVVATALLCTQRH